MVCSRPLCGIDSETTLIQNSYEVPDVVIAGFYSGDRCQLVMWDNLRQYLEIFLKINPKTKLVFFNLPFDVDVMGPDIFIPELDKDGRMMELGANYRIHLIGTQGWLPGKITLYDVTLRTLHVHLNKEDGTRTSFQRGQEMTKEQLEYLVCDCAATGMCGEAYNNMPTESIQARACYVLSQMTRNGVLVDREHLNNKIKEYTKTVERCAQELRAFGFRPKGKMDGESAKVQLAVAAEAVGVEGATAALEGVQRVPDGYAWVLASILYNKISTGTALPSDLQETLRQTIEMVVKGSIDWTKKSGKDMIAQAKTYLAEQLQEIDCATCITGIGSVKPRSVKPAWKIIELLCDLYGKGRLSDSMEAFNKEFYDEHEYFLGWLNVDDKKPLSPEKFVQQHLIKLMEDHPGLVFPLTDGAKKKVAKYIRVCGRKKENPDPEVLKSLSKYAYSSSDSWMLSDLGITDPFLELYAEFKHAQKLLGTYFVTKYIEGDGRNHARYDFFKVTGRTGSYGPDCSLVAG